MKTAKELWADPVWSKVIASLIAAVIFGSIALLRQTLWQTIANAYKQAYELAAWISLLLIQNVFMVLTFVLFFIVIVLLYKLRSRNKLSNEPAPSAATKWFNSQNQGERYLPILMWFPANRTLITPRYYSDTESLDHIPEIVDLLHRKALIKRQENAVQYSFQIDRELYRIIEKEFHSPDKEADAEQLIEHLRRTDFIYLFPKRKF
ncbi:MAG: hypothetical protein WBW16_15595 [Bacteroidota bacterium]